MIASLALFVAHCVGLRGQSAPRVGYDGHCIQVDGKDTFIFSGAFHYFRCPKPLWRDRLRKMKQAGLNAVETYVAWNWHERTAPRDLKDMSKVDMTDLRDFLKMVHDEFGMYSIVRPGPYICAEWSGGGYPRWLVAHRPKGHEGVWYRTDDPAYLAWCKHWYDAVCPVIAKEQITHKPTGKPGTILVQIENEYDYAGLPQKAMVGQLKALRKYAKANGVDVPLFTCWTWPVRRRVDPELADVFDGSNLYPRHDIRGAGGTVASLRQSQPNAPVMVPELQGGWFGQIGGQLSEDQYGLEDTQIRALTLECILQGGTILSYYMFFGGSHLDDFAARGLTTSYDYNAPLREWGGVGDRYQAVRGMGEMLQQIGPALARSEKLDIKPETTLKDVRIGARLGSDGRTYVFVFNSNEREARTGEIRFKVGAGDVTLPVNLPPFDFRIAVLPRLGESAATWWPKEPVAPSRPTQEPPMQRLATAQKVTDGALGKRWFPRLKGQDLLDLGVTEAPFTLWRTRPSLTSAQIAKSDVLNVLMNVDDAVVAKINGAIVHPNSTAGRRATFDVKGKLQPGVNDIELIYEDKMLPNGGEGMEKLGFVSSGFLGSSVGQGRQIDDWRVVEVEDATAGRKLIGENVDDKAWQTCKPGDETSKLISNRRATAVFRTTLEISEADLKAKSNRIVFERIDDMGTVFINGQEVARHNDWSSPLDVDGSKTLRPGKNVIAVIITNRDGEGGLTLPVRLAPGLSDGIDLSWEVCPQLDGVARGWTKGIPKGMSGPVRLSQAREVPRKGSSSPSGRSEALATWYQVEFEAPAPGKDEWFPWRALIDASGNGFLYLNGHPIGRYWQVGPQREYFLPECYLNFGKKKNVLVLCLRPTEQGAELGSVAVGPYPGQGEIRK